MGRTLLKTAPRRIGLGSPPALFRRWEPFPKRDASRLGSHSYGRSPSEGFAFLIPAPAAGARSLLVPGTCDLTHRRTDASDAAAPGARKGPNIRAP